MISFRSKLIKLDGLTQSYLYLTTLITIAFICLYIYTVNTLFTHLCLRD